MGLRKGQTNNKDGRPKGSLNRLSKGLRLKISDFLEMHFDDVVKEWQSMEGKDKLQFYKDLIQYAVPKMQSMELQSDFSNLTNEDLDNIINELKTQAYEQRIKN